MYRARVFTLLLMYRVKNFANEMPFIAENCPRKIKRVQMPLFICYTSTFSLFGMKEQVRRISIWNAIEPSNLTASHRPSVARSPLPRNLLETEESSLKGKRAIASEYYPITRPLFPTLHARPLSTPLLARQK